MSLALEAFVENVREFCDWIESDQHTLQPVRQTLLALLQGTPYLVVSGSTEPAADDFPRRNIVAGWRTLPGSRNFRCNIITLHLTRLQLMTKRP